LLQADGWTTAQLIAIRGSLSHQEFFDRGLS